MATLHVRNVPDDLYERLRARAKLEGRSLSAEVVQLLGQALIIVPRPEKNWKQVIQDLPRWTPPLGAPTATELIREDRDR